MDGGEGRVFCDGKGGIYIDLFWWLGNCEKKKCARANEDEDCSRTPPQDFMKW
jgi:hypothetical protein